VLQLIQRLGLSIRDAVIHVLQLIQRLGLSIRDAVIWLYQTSYRYLGLIEATVLHIFQAAWRTFKFVFCILAGLSILLGTLMLARSAYRIYRSYKHRLEILCLEEARDGAAQAWLQWSDVIARGSRERNARLQQQRQEEEHQRRMAEEYQRRVAEEERRRREAREVLRANALREQRRSENARLRRRWREACDEILAKGTGELPRPPRPNGISCQTPYCHDKWRASGTCEHDLMALFDTSTEESMREVLKDERNRWHPNSPAINKLRDFKDQNQQLATEISQIIQILLDNAPARPRDGYRGA